MKVVSCFVLSLSLPYPTLTHCPISPSPTPPSPNRTIHSLHARKEKTEKIRKTDQMNTHENTLRKALVEKGRKEGKGDVAIANVTGRVGMGRSRRVFYFACIVVMGIMMSFFKLKS